MITQGTATQADIEGLKAAVKAELYRMDLIPGLDVHPFTQFVWRSAEARLKWAGRFKMARSLHDRTEYEMVKRGHRRCATLHIGPRDYDAQIERIAKDGLMWLPITRTKTYSGFAHRHYATDASDPNSTVYGALARTLEDAEAFRTASGHGAQDGKADHANIGDLLGFPKCCCDFFNEVWPMDYYDPLWQAAVCTDGAERMSETHLKVRGSVFAHQLLRYLGFRITSHLPCSFQCEETVRIGKVWLEVMRDLDRLGTDALLDILRLPLRWRCYRGVAILETEAFIASTNSMPTEKEYIIDFKTAD